MPTAGDYGAPAPSAIPSSRGPTSNRGAVRGGGGALGDYGASNGGGNAYNHNGGGGLRASDDRYGGGMGAGGGEDDDLAMLRSANVSAFMNLLISEMQMHPCKMRVGEFSSIFFDLYRGVHNVYPEKVANSTIRNIAKY